MFKWSDMKRNAVCAAPKITRSMKECQEKELRYTAAGEAVRRCYKRLFAEALTVMYNHKG